MLQSHRARRCLRPVHGRHHSHRRDAVLEGLDLRHRHRREREHCAPVVRKVLQKKGGRGCQHRAHWTRRGGGRWAGPGARGGAERQRPAPAATATARTCRWCRKPRLEVRRGGEGVASLSSLQISEQPKLALRLKRRHRGIATTPCHRPPPRGTHSCRCWPSSCRRSPPCSAASS